MKDQVKDEQRAVGVKFTLECKENVRARYLDRFPILGVELWMEQQHSGRPIYLFIGPDNRILKILPTTEFEDTPLSGHLGEDAWEDVSSILYKKESTSEEVTPKDWEDMIDKIKEKEAQPKDENHPLDWWTCGLDTRMRQFCEGPTWIADTGLVAEDDDSINFIVRKYTKIRYDKDKKSLDVSRCKGRHPMLMTMDRHTGKVIFRTLDEKAPLELLKMCFPGDERSISLTDTFVVTSENNLMAGEVYGKLSRASVIIPDGWTDYMRVVDKTMRYNKDFYFINFAGVPEIPYEEDEQ